MRLSGSYLDRLLYNILPVTIFAGLIFYFTKPNTQFFFAIEALIGISITYWILDTIIIYTKFKKPKQLKINEGCLFINQEKINPTDIDKVTPLNDRRARWLFEMIELKLKDGRTFMFIDKPQTIISIFNRESQTITRLIKEYPELKTKIKSEKYI